LSRFK